MLISLTAAALLMSLADQDGVISTAPRGQAPLPLAEAAEVQVASPSTTVGSATPHGQSTAEQISNWIGQGRNLRPSPERPWATIAEEPGPRKPHGEVSVGFGTGGYRDYSAAVQLPLGENGTLNLAVRQSKNDHYAFDPYYNRHGAWDGYDGFRGAYAPLSGLGSREFMLMDGRSRWHRERVSSQDSSSAYGTTSKGVSVGLNIAP